MTLEELKKRLQANPHLHLDNEQCLKLLKMVAGGRCGLLGVCCDKADCVHDDCKWAREWLDRLDEIERSL